MKIKIGVGILIVVCFFFLLPEPEHISVSKKTTSNDTFHQSLSELNSDFILRNINLYDGEKLHHQVDIRIEKSRVVIVGINVSNENNLFEVDGAGRTVIPGLIDSHTHTWGNALELALNFGVTTELDMFTMPDFSRQHQKLRERLDNDQQADLFSATILATAPGGHGTEYGFNIPVIESVEQVEDFVTARIADGADYIKAVYDAPENPRKHFPSISRDILKELIRTTHNKNKMLVVHVDNLVSAHQAIDAGADGIIHSFMDKVADDAFVKLMKRRNAFIIPTLLVEASMVGLKPGEFILNDSESADYLSRMQRQQISASFMDFGIEENAFQRALASVAKLSKAGVTILSGSDAPNPGTTHGASIHAEMMMLVDAGLTPEQALHSATGAVSQTFNIGLRGTLKVGAPASMVLLEGNPLENIEQTRNIRAVWKNGKFYARKKYLSEQDLSPAIKPQMISDFNSDEKNTAFGAGITPTTDQFAGGKSIVALNWERKADQPKDKYLRVVGEVKAGFAFPWSGFSFIPGEDFSSGANLSQIESLSFEAKGVKDMQTLSVLVFQEGSFQPSSLNIPLEKEWKTFTIEFSQLQGIDLSSITNISLVESGKVGEFEFMIDNLRFD
ncbi:amidohydrolase family protein [Aliikangiella coralliicola]|uniref:Amidohydrolase family protein n=1 Tax=Aliikangiella coralliicola TaxID=2592383 RepID=A0A545UEL0_9GAMM|nr:amidohydrolase family protein [Aliikangiella coralliicola]TQV87907.1 amidohydrolase family protein [Aliikangiella coralliicola]